jgi:hypothetical protein
MDPAFTIRSILLVAAILGLIGLGALLLPRLHDDSPAWVFACGGSTGLVIVAALALVGVALMALGDEWGR